MVDGQGRAVFRRHAEVLATELDRIRPPLWLHGHIAPATISDWRVDHDGTIVANATPVLLVEILSPASDEPTAID